MVTPGNVPPDASVTAPAIVPVVALIVCAIDMVAVDRIRMSDRMRWCPNRLFIDSPS
jgi:hypothetical protein